MSGFPTEPEPEPGAQPRYTPYGSNAYGSNPYGGVPAGPSTDPVSITGFVLSLLCCTSVVGVILGVIGLRRTKDGARRGRWAAVAAIPIGIAGTLAFVATIGFFTWFGTSTVLLSSADVGQCLNVDDFSGSNDATLWKKDCDEAHDAEVAVAASFDRDLLTSYEANGDNAFCVALLNDDYATAHAGGDYDVDLVFEASDPELDDDFLCLLERADGDKLDAPIGG